MIRRTTNIPIEQIKIEDDGSHLVIKSKINGKIVRMLIDTGASRTVFDSERIKNLLTEKSFVQHDKLSTGLGTNSMPTSIATIKSFRIGELLISDFTTVLLDLRHVNETYEAIGHLSIDGVIGNDILTNYRATIDYGKLLLKLKLKRGNSF